MNNSENLHAGHRKHFRERFLRVGEDGFADHELIELLLFFSVPRCNTNETARRLIAAFGSFPAVFHADLKSLTAVEGVGDSSALLIKLTGAIMRRYLQQSDCAHVLTVRKTEDVLPYLQRQFVAMGHEVCLLLMFDAGGGMISCMVLGRGNAGSVPFDFRECMRHISLTDPAFIILAHNHPTGISAVSDDDIRITLQLKEVLDLMGIPLMEHLVLAGSSYCGILDTVRRREEAERLRKTGQMQTDGKS